VHLDEGAEQVLNLEFEEEFAVQVAVDFLSVQVGRGHESIEVIMLFTLCKWALQSRTKRTPGQCPRRQPSAC